MYQELVKYDYYVSRDLNTDTHSATWLKRIDVVINKWVKNNLKSLINRGVFHKKVTDMTVIL